MIEQCLERLSRLLFPCLAGSGLILAATAIGWWGGRHRQRWPARVVRWWLNRVVRPLLASRSVSRRAAIIAANNAATCAGMVALGAVGVVAWLAVAAVGLSLGLALRLMSAAPPRPAAEPPPPARAQQVAAAIGVGFNLLEIPAIALAAGLCLAQEATSPSIEWAQAWQMFALLVLPTLMLAAIGEALWMGVYPPWGGLSAGGEAPVA